MRLHRQQLLLSLRWLALRAHLEPLPGPGRFFDGRSRCLVFTIASSSLPSIVVTEQCLLSTGLLEALRLGGGGGGVFRETPWFDLGSLHFRRKKMRFELKPLE